MCPGPNGATTEQIAESLSSPARQALREWAEYPSRTNSSQTVEAVARANVPADDQILSVCGKRRCAGVLCGGRISAQSLAAGTDSRMGVQSGAGAILRSSAVRCAAARLAQTGRVERVRRETTAALAHELKTPLSVLQRHRRAAWRQPCTGKAGTLSGCHPAAGAADGRRCATDARTVETGDRRKGSAANGVLSGRIGAGSACRRLCRPIPPSTPNLQHRANTRSMRTGHCSRGHWTLCSERRAAHTGRRLHHGAPRGRLALGDEHRQRHSGGRVAAAVGGVLSGRSVAQQKGDGLGLSIAKTVFDLHGFTCGAENTEIGPKFWFRFADK